MVSNNPFGDFRANCEEALEQSLKKLYPSTRFKSLPFEVPLKKEFGELASTALFDLGKNLKIDPRQLAQQVADTISVEEHPLLRAVTVAGGGYVNFHAAFDELSRTTIDSVRSLDAEYGHVKTDRPLKLIVEHTSANPISPLSIGQARNPILGDALARILSARGHHVNRHFYVDDVGRQTAVVAYGHSKLQDIAFDGKPDHYLGLIYTLTSCIIETNRLKQELERNKDSASEATQQLQKQLDEWVSITAVLERKHRSLFKSLLQSLSKDQNLEKIISDLNREYELGEERAKKLIRRVCELSLAGIKETLSKIDITFDSWDWESTFAWNSDVSKVLKALKDTEYVYQEGPVLEFDADRVADNLGLKSKLGLGEDYEIPSLTLVRADGTTLYTTRDIPYSLWKFKRADKVINVVGLEQRLPQMQLRLALWALGHSSKAKNLVHFAHNLVTLPGYKMSSRRGRYITLDQVVEEAIKRAYEEVEKRSPQRSMKEKTAISKIVGIGALKYALAEVDPIKPVVFTWDRVINFERNSAPYIQYSYARARSILRKAEKVEKPNCALLVKPIEHDLVLILARYPEVFIDSAENLKPNSIAEYANLLADKFNTFYNALPAIRAKPKELSEARVALVEATSIVLRNALNLIGIIAPERM
ncbi:MAG: arginine--tRNA ligase [Candidatus Bathyarchaeota archaeon]|nr:MAG: arginine--tRNA ligase [Candidatus Bathyarchaeota archaeon]